MIPAMRHGWWTIGSASVVPGFRLHSSQTECDRLANFQTSAVGVNPVPAELLQESAMLNAIEGIVHTYQPCPVVKQPNSPRSH